MKAEIYYFSGTGNSLFIAKQLAVSLHASLTPLALARHHPEIRTDAEIIGIVFPVYYGGLPVIVRDFVSRLRNMEGKFTFAVCNYGGAAGSTLRALRQILATGGGTLSAGYGMHMPQNAFRKPRENHEQILATNRRRLASVAASVLAQKKGVFMDSPLLELIGTPLYALLKPFYTKTSGNGPLHRRARVSSR